MKSVYSDGRKFQFEGSYLTKPINLGSIKLYQLGELCCEPGYVIEEHWQCCHEITYIISGAGESCDDGKTVAFEAGDVLINRYAHMHSMKATGQEPMRYAYVGFLINADNIYNDLTRIDAFFNSFDKQKAHASSDMMNFFLHCLEEFYMRSDFSRFMIEIYILQIIISACRDFSKETDAVIKKNPIDETQSIGQAVYSVIQYINKNIYNLDDVQVMAKKLGYNPCYLSHVFKEKMGVTIKQYISKKKIQVSLDLLETRHFPITHIAHMLNYANVQSYSRMFKQVVGIYPTEYLKNLSGVLK